MGLVGGLSAIRTMDAFLIIEILQTHPWMLTFAWLLVGHAVADGPLQGSWMSRAKWGLVDDMPWWQALTLHATIHGGAVLAVTGRVDLAILEALSHATIDYSKCRGKISFVTDQVLHVLCKVVWLLMVL